MVHRHSLRRVPRRPRVRWRASRRCRTRHCFNANLNLPADFEARSSNPITAEETRQKPDYEQQCYRASEAIVRGRLEQLQDYVQKMTKSLPDPALLQRQSEPACGFRGPLSHPITAEETRQKLDYEQQCYRASETIVRGRLGQLQDYVQKMIKSRRTRVTSGSYKQFSCSTPIAQLLMFLADTPCSTEATNGIR
jgi:hypothetical protein